MFYFIAFFSISTSDICISFPLVKMQYIIAEFLLHILNEFYVFHQQYITQRTTFSPFITFIYYFQKRILFQSNFLPHFNEFQLNMSSYETNTIYFRRFRLCGFTIITNSVSTFLTRTLLDFFCWPLLAITSMKRLAWRPIVKSYLRVGCWCSYKSFVVYGCVEIFWSEK